MDKIIELTYNKYLFGELLALHNPVYKEMEYDRRFDLIPVLYMDFASTLYNTTEKSEYDCILDYLKDKDWTGTVLEESPQNRQRRLENELKRDVEIWVDRTFNQIQLDTIEDVLRHNGEELIEYIRPKEIDYGYIIDNYGLEDEFDNFLKEKYDDESSDFLEDEDEMKEFLEENYPNYIDEYNRDHFPMWNTLFETKSSWTWDKLLEGAESVGCGIVESNDHFNEMIFMTSAGHSFYAAYWIPMYLYIFDYEREKYKGIKYDHL